MAKGNRTTNKATKRVPPAQPTQTTTTATTTATQTAQPTQTPPTQATPNPLQQQIQPNIAGVPILQGGAQDIKMLTDDELAQLFIASQTADMPDQLNDATGAANLSQKFVYQAGLNDKPQVMDDATFDAYVKQNGLQNKVLRRDVDPIAYTVGTTRYNYTADEIAQQFNGGMFNYVGGKHGGAAHGYGTYFERGRAGTRTNYGGRQCKTMQCVLNPQTASVINESALYRAAPRFAKTHPKFAKAVGSINRSNQSVYALAMGANVVDDGSGYVVVLDRKAVIARQNAF